MGVTFGRAGDWLPLGVDGDDGDLRHNNNNIQHHNNDNNESRISPEQLEELIRRGLRPDLALLPYQMPRLDHNGIPPPPPVDTGLDTRWIKSYGNIVRSSIRRLHVENGSLVKIGVTVDASMPMVMIVTVNGKDRRGTVVFDEAKHSAGPMVQKVVQIQAGIGQDIEFELDLESKELESMYTATQAKFGVPVVFRLEKKRGNSPLVEPKKSKSSRRNSDDSIKTEVDAQITYAAFTSTVSSPKNQSSLSLKLLRQVVQIGNRFYTMKEIYGSKRGRSNSTNAMNSDCVICMCNYGIWVYFHSFVSLLHQRTLPFYHADTCVFAKIVLHCYVLNQTNVPFAEAVGSEFLLTFAHVSI
jgi:hypothetical protein